jgi:hypothetical protein
MRVKAMWTIGNKTGQKIYWGLYKTDDKAYASTWKDHDGYIDANGAVDFESEVDEAQIVFWESAPVFGIGSKLAVPKLVKTDRPVTLTREKKVVQPDAPEFVNPNRVGGAVTLFDGFNENNFKRGLAIAIAGKIPEVGGAIAAVIELVWAEEKPDLIKESEERMKKWVRGQIHDYDRQQLTSHLSGLRANLLEYVNATSPGERRRWLDVCLAACNHTRPFFIKSMAVKDYTPGTIGLAADVALVHLGLLRERALFAREIFGDEKVDAGFFRRQLRDAVAEWQKFFRDVAVPGELAWREGQIDVQSEHGPYHLYLKDWVTREVHAFHKSGRNQLSQGPSTVCVDIYKAQAISDYGRELRHNVLEPAALWSLLDPDHPANAMSLEPRFWAGPYSGLSYMFGNEHNFRMYDSVEEVGARVTHIRVRSHDRIDALQIGFDGQQGRMVGNAGGGTQHDVPVPQGAHLTGMETWWDFDLFAVRFHFSDGSSSPTFGKPERGSVHQRVHHPDHAITGVRIGNRMHELYVAFSPLPDYLQRAEAEATRALEARRRR